MKYCDKCMTIAFYAIFLGSVILEIAFLFEIPYYAFSNLLKSIKIVRILLGIINFLIDLFFLVIKYAENLIKKEEKGHDSSSTTKRYNLMDKILIIVAFLISIITLTLNITGIVACRKYLQKSSPLPSYFYVDSLLLLIENILVSLCWIYFIVYWGFHIKGFIEVKEHPKKTDENNAPPSPLDGQQPSSERNVKSNETDIQ